MPDPSGNLEEPIDVVVTLNEINDQHGTGPLVKRVLKGRPNIYTIRSRTDWGEQDFGDWNAFLPQEGSRAQSFRNVLGILGGRKLRSILCVPFLRDELITSIALHASFNADLCCWIMDDQNVAVNNVSDELMHEFLERCSLRLVTHMELRHAYERKYGMQFHILPAVIPASLISSEPAEPNEDYSRSRRGALVGSFWDQAWFSRTCSTLAGCDCIVDWYGNNRSPWFSFSDEVMQQAQLRPQGLIPETQLAARLRDYPFVIVPVGSLDDRERNTGVAHLSLPGRILFSLATAHTPTIVLGSEDTCAARFVRHFQVGRVVPYSAEHLTEAIDHLTERNEQLRLRRNAARVSRTFSDAGIVEWLAKSIRSGAPVDERFEKAFQGYDSTAISHLVQARLPVQETTPHEPSLS